MGGLVDELQSLSHIKQVRLKTGFTWFGGRANSRTLKFWRLSLRPLQSGHSGVMSRRAVGPYLVAAFTGEGDYQCMLMFGAWLTPNIGNRRHRLWHIHFQASVRRGRCKVGLAVTFMRNKWHLLPIGFQSKSPRRLAHNHKYRIYSFSAENNHNCINYYDGYHCSKDRRSRSSWNKKVMTCHTTS